MKKKTTRIVIGTTDKTRPSLHAAVQLARYGAHRKPDESDRPPPSTFPGRKPQHIDGQLSLNEEGGNDAA